MFYLNKYNRFGVCSSFLLLLAILLAISAFPLSATAAEPLSQQEQSMAGQINNAIRRAVEIVRPAVVSVSVSKHVETGPFYQGGQSRSLGSGCIIDKRGYIITNNHVVADTEKVEIILADGRRFKAVEKLFDPDTDLALVKIDPGDEELPTATFGDSDKTHVGDFVLAMGSPFGLTQTVTGGIVSFKGRPTGILGKWGYEDFIQTDAQINKGNSGGPLVNLYGEVIGINSNILTPTGVSTGYGFAVPSVLAKFVTDRLIDQKKVRRAWLGVMMVCMDDLRKFGKSPKMVADKDLQMFLDSNKDYLAEIPDSIKGIMAFKVLKDDPADRAGIKEKDIIISFNGKKFSDSKLFRSYIARLQPGKTVPVVIWRKDGELTLQVSLGDRAVARENETGREKFAKKNQHLSPFPPFPDSQNEHQKEKNKKAALGVQVQALNPQLAREFGYSENLRCVVIVNVYPDSIARQSGLEVGDIIVSVDDVTIKKIGQLEEIIKKTDLVKEGIKIVVRTLKGERTITIKRQEED